MVALFSYPARSLITKLSPDAFSLMMDEAAQSNHVSVVSYCLSNGGSVTTNMIDNIADGLSFETYKFLVEEGAAEIIWVCKDIAICPKLHAGSDNLTWAEFWIRRGVDANTYHILPELVKYYSLWPLAFFRWDWSTPCFNTGADLQGSGAVVPAAGYGRLDTLSFLLSKGADIHEFPPTGREGSGSRRQPRESITRSCDSRTAGGWRDIYSVITQGFKISLRGSQGRTPLNQGKRKSGHRCCRVIRAQIFARLCVEVDKGKHRSRYSILSPELSIWKTSFKWEFWGRMRDF